MQEEAFWARFGAKLSAIRNSYSAEQHAASANSAHAGGALGDITNSMAATAPAVRSRADVASIKHTGMSHAMIRCLQMR